MTITRRKFIGMVGVASIVSIAGCSGSSTNLDENDGDVDNVFEESPTFDDLSLTDDGTQIVVRLDEYPEIGDADYDLPRTVRLIGDGRTVYNEVEWVAGKQVYTFDVPDEEPSFYRIAVVRREVVGSENSASIEALVFSTTDGSIVVEEWEKFV